MIQKYLSGISLAILMGFGLEPVHASTQAPKLDSFATFSIAQLHANSAAPQDHRFSAVNLRPDITPSATTTGAPPARWSVGVVDELPDGGAIIGWTKFGLFVYSKHAEFPGSEYSQWHVDASGKVLSKGPNYYFGKGWEPLSISDPDVNGRTYLVWGLLIQSFKTGVTYVESVSIWTLDSTGTVISKGPINPVPGNRWQEYAGWYNADGTISIAYDQINADKNGTTVSSRFKISQYAADGTLITNGPEQFQKGQWQLSAVQVKGKNYFNLQWTKVEYNAQLQGIIPDSVHVKQLSPSGNVIGSWSNIQKINSILLGWTLQEDGTDLMVWEPFSSLIDGTDRIDIWKADTTGKIVLKSGDFFGDGAYVTCLYQSPVSGYLLGWSAPNFIDSLWTLDDKMKLKNIGSNYVNNASFWVTNYLYAPDGTIRLPVDDLNYEQVSSYDSLGRRTDVGPFVAVPDGTSPVAFYFDAQSNYVEWYYGPTNGSPFPDSYAYYTKRDVTGNVIYTSPIYFKK